MKFVLADSGEILRASEIRKDKFPIHAYEQQQVFLFPLCKFGLDN